MSEQVFGLTAAGIARTAETNRRVLGELPDTGRRTRRVFPQGGGGGGAQSVYFRILNFCPELFAYGQGCACYEAEVTRVLCSSSIIVGDIITIRDPDRCWLNLPADLLFDRKGKATLFKTGTDNGGLHCETDESALQVPGCIWIVDFLCCVEEDYATAF